MASLPVSPVQILFTGKARDTTVSPDGKTVYVADQDGWLSAFDVATGNLSGRWKVGASLGGMAVSKDGASLVATEQAVPDGTGSGANYVRTYTVHVLNLSTGVVRDYSVTADGNQGAYTDAQFTADGKILLTQYSNNLNGLSLLDPSTGSFSHLADPSYTHLGSLSGSADGSTVLIGAGGLNQLSVYTYKAGTGLTLVHGNTDAAGSNTGVQAISSDGALILEDNTFYRNGQKIYLPPLQPALGIVSGWTFSPDSQHAYMLDVQRGLILQLSTVDWSIERSLSAGFTLGSGGALGADYGDRLSATSDGKYLVVWGPDSVAAINLQTVVPLGGTDKADVITGGGSGDILYGFAGNDVMKGGAGDDTLYGGTGDDVLFGTAGKDTLDGGDGVDTVDYSGATQGMNINLYFYFANDNHGGASQTLTAIENVVGTRFDDLIQGDMGANRLEGGDGADHITGLGGNDILLGGAGDDVLDGGLGDDTLDGGAGNDIAAYQMVDSGVTVDLTISGPQNTGGGGTDTLISIEGLTGSIYSDVLKGDAQANVIDGDKGDDQIFGGAGDDVLTGGAGNDVIDGGAGDDIAHFSSFSWNYSVVQNADGSTTVKDLRSGSPDGTDTLRSVEHLVFGPSASESALRTEISYLLRQTNAYTPLTADQQSLLAQWSSGALNADQVVGKLIAMAGATTSVATLSYEFFTGKIPESYGVDYLVSPTGPNANNLNSAYYQSFNLENRYINFAVNLGKLGEGKDAFAAKYGSLNLFDATREAYKAIFGAAPTDAKIHAMIDSRADYFAYYGGDGASGIGTKAAMVGWLLAEAVKADVGIMAKSNDAWLTDLSDGSAPFAIDILDPAKGYYKADFIFGG